MSEDSFRMVIEDTFLVRGRGTVVSGKVESGNVRKGDEVTLLSHQMKPLMTATIQSIPYERTYINSILFLVDKAEMCVIAEQEMIIIVHKQSLSLEEYSTSPESFFMLIGDVWSNQSNEVFVEGIVESGELKTGDWVRVFFLNDTFVDTSVHKLQYSEDIIMDNHALNTAKIGDHIYIYLSDGALYSFKDATHIIIQEE